MVRGRPALRRVHRRTRRDLVGGDAEQDRGPSGLRFLLLAQTKGRAKTRPHFKSRVFGPVFSPPDLPEVQTKSAPYYFTICERDFFAASRRVPRWVSPRLVEISP